MDITDLTVVTTSFAILRMTVISSILLLSGSSFRRLACYLTISQKLSTSPYTYEALNYERKLEYRRYSSVLDLV
jgi:hypothetical protein